MSEPLIELSATELRARRGKKWREVPSDVYPAWIADMDYLTAEPIRHALRSMSDDADFVYSTLSAQVAQAHAQRMLDTFGWKIDPGHTLVIADLVQGVTAALLALSRPGDGVVLTSPSYPPLIEAIEATGRRLVEVPLLEGAGNALDYAGLQAALATEDVSVLVLCNPHNPTGRVLDRAELDKVADIVVDSNVTVVSDEIHCDLVLPGSTHIPFGSLGPEIADKTVTLHSATKAYNLGGLRCGVLHMGSDALLQRFWRTHPERLLGRVNNYGALATMVAWNDATPWLDAMLRQLDANRIQVMEWAEAVPGVSFQSPEGTYFAWLDCRQLTLEGEDPADFFLRVGRVALSPGRDFGPRYRGYARLNFATSPTILTEILRRLSSAVSILESETDVVGDAVLSDDAPTQVR